MKSQRPFFRSALASLLLAATATVALAQTSVSTPSDLTARAAGDREFTLGGAGAVNTDFDDSLGGLNFSYGWYTSETQQWVLRQTVNYSNPDRGEQSWNGSTRIAFDQHLASSGPLIPFVGVNVGGVYGESVRETFAAGLEAGGKYYVRPNTFVYGLVEYGWFFRRASSADDTFRDGQFTWTVGLGFNF